MKRLAEKSPEDTIPAKRICLEIPENQLIIDIKKNIFSLDPIAVGKLLSTEEACQLSKEQKNELHKTAKGLKKNIFEVRKLGSVIAQQTDNVAIKEKFSYDAEYKNIQKTTRYLYALKFLPNFTFPQVMFTPAPLCNYQQDLRIKPDQALIALIKNEQTGIHVCCYHITIANIAKALIKKAKSGVSVEIITDQSQGRNDKDYCTVKTLIDSGISVLSPQKVYEQMHHKFFIFDSNICDQSLLWTGSYNPTPHGNSHSWDDANIFDIIAMIKQYRARFGEIKNSSKKYIIPIPQPHQPNKLPTICMLTK
ncbi:MAG TPA: phospholipase D-like domain-containing protein [Candidatus Babeliales bacterium]|nr:phospholipase D-like domain-containing protein [Candidatus Babeliales bacterium]HLC07005.1 phospholipase D-like domain-containing protein [Candidatus Babeliales bacterium]